ncbi:PAS domain-containing protein [Treponema primitia]|uniref:helix-turn-helix transcriptional regulator n=1 Tax=Treponema primitia TaxID=88058 RepID=UPI0039800F44
MTTTHASITVKDKQILDSVKPIVDGIAAFMGENCEVVLHSLESLDCSVIHIANSHVTGRGLGSPITELGMKILRESANTSKDVTDCSYSKTTDGKTLRSITVTIRNPANKPIGMICINMNMNAPLLSLINTLAIPQAENPEGPENFVTNLDELIQTTLRATIININGHHDIPNHEKNKTIVCELIKKGLFDIRGAIDIVARELSVSRYTIYNYIREHKSSQKKETV